jgi:hypothetical protein
MTAPYQRRRDPTGFTQGWEVAVAVIGLAAIGLALAALAGRGLAAAAFGDGWVWPHGVDAIGHTLRGVATGHPGRGLPPGDAARVAPPTLTYLCIAACELAVITGTAVAGTALARRFRNDGMATRRDAEQALGVSELRRSREIIRPDLYAPRVIAKDAPARQRAGLWRRGTES